MSEPIFFGRTWDQIQCMQQRAGRAQIDVHTPGDCGADPLGEGRFKMVPSGDIVDTEERNRRLGRRG